MSNNVIFVGGDLEKSLLTLGVDTSTERRSVALYGGGRVLAESSSGLREGGSASLLSDVDRMLASAGVKLKEVGLYAAAVGPGSFTGLRSGLATVKGLALTTGRPAVGVQTLHALAYSVRPAARVVSLIPAGRGEVFAQMLSVSAEGVVSELEEPTHLPPALLLERMAAQGGGLKWAGGGALKFLELIRERAAAKGLEFAEPGAHVPLAEGAWVFEPAAEALAATVAEMASASYASGAATQGLTAVYVRPSDAELKDLCHAQK
ncbi:MAG: tRNA (adenosine(37)-N6)-threonylcarbamoyltransferase complex dimerization subunit type 1 TsaB [Acidobacteria bacterium]|nr:tRNA (adenosine(37)-N6)-threonylcarbamoyltransferase complex dimerization subunit type 1 TsaB [Acidobacteriota bacterium]